ncbi:YbfB/YjiJ family MFS transporter [Paenibacillus allorhizosphaerae]|uniref:Major facilitator superfamily (MFS) profile domain-containing protein n=1 Tax=Paenibacillus allorhizosphaerae TaxID=2849866 RepID=A0ABM8VIV7_9BACL|nr:YbfB/YjiJ family MFS transporter [Paenibacillus allorhizosphaerae]CAG7644578.1 hypothetical protein PAECIP111802_03320 [Paenibacillus allorhizosphaerae]
MNYVPPPTRALIGGIGALVIAMGVGRFAYTPILPYLQQAAGVTGEMAGYLASSNYLGYLLGALLAGAVRWNRGKSAFLKVFLGVNILTTLMMGMTGQYSLWLLLRFVSGLTSGLVFVLASSIALDAFAIANRPAWSGLLYSGVGIGIATSGIAVPFLAEQYGWPGAWIGLGVFALCIGFFSFLWLQDKVSSENGPTYDRAAARSGESGVFEKADGAGAGADAEEGGSAGARDATNADAKRMLPWLLVSYGCEGLGYIISGTFLVAIVHSVPSFGALGALSWVLVGAAAIPSSVMWAKFAGKYGNAPALYLAFITQMVGVVLPVVIFNAAGALLGAILFGATFMGITTLSVSEARSLMPADSNKAIGYMTFVYSIGQMIGPSIAGKLITRSGGYDSSLIFAALVLFCGIVCLAAGRRVSTKIKTFKG